MKNEYIKAELEVVLFENVDVITTSNTDSIDPDNNYDPNSWT